MLSAVSSPMPRTESSLSLSHSPSAIPPEALAIPMILLAFSSGMPDLLISGATSSGSAAASLPRSRRPALRSASRDARAESQRESWTSTAETAISSALESPPHHLGDSGSDGYHPYLGRRESFTSSILRRTSRGASTRRLPIAHILAPGSANNPGDVRGR
jgi:hypothetical protein